MVERGVINHGFNQFVLSICSKNTLRVSSGRGGQQAGVSCVTWTSSSAVHHVEGSSTLGRHHW